MRCCPQSGRVPPAPSFPTHLPVDAVLGEVEDMGWEPSRGEALSFLVEAGPGKTWSVS